MSYQKLERAAELFGALKALNQEISEIHEIAMKLAEGKFSANFSMNLNCDEPEMSQVSDGYRRAAEELRSDLMDYARQYQGYQGVANTTMNSGLFPPGAKAISLGPFFSAEVTDTVGLQILGIMMGEKRVKRNRLIGEIKELNLE